MNITPSPLSPASPARFRPVLVALVLGAATAIIPSARAFNFGDTVYWNGGGGTWDTTNAEWSTDATFATGLAAWTNPERLEAIFNGPGSAITLANPITFGALTFNTGGYTLSGSALTINNATASITTAGAVTIAANILTTNSAYTLVKAGAGTLTLTGTAALAADINAGTLMIGSGGVFGGVATDSANQIRLYASDANFIVSAGGTATGFSLGIFEGAATISGTGATLTTGSVSLGRVVNATNHTGAGTLTIADGATVTTTGTAELGYDGVATVTVGGTDTQWSVRNLRLGTFDGADGTLTQTGGLVNVTNKLYFGQSGAGKGTYRLEGGTLAVGTSSGIQATGTANYLFELAGGTVKVTGTNLTSSVRVSLRSDTVSTIDTNSLNGTFSGIISGAGSLEKTGAGNLILSGANTFTGNLRVNAGTLRATTNDAALGAGTLTLAGGNLELANNSVRNFGRNTTLTADSTLTSDRTSNGAAVTHTLGTLSLGAHTLSVNRGSFATSDTAGITFGATTLTGNATFNVGSNARLTLGAVSGAHGFTKSGSGNLTLTGANTHTGLTAINAGTLALGSTATLVNTSAIRVDTFSTFDVSAISGGFTLASGQSLGGSGSVTGLINLSSGARLAPGNSPGTITFTGGLTLNAGSILDFELGTTSDLIRVNGGTLSSTGTITVNLADSGGFTEGTYTLIDATGATLSSIGATSFELGTVIAGYTYTFSQTGNQFQLTASAIPEPASVAALFGILSFALAARRRRRTK